MATLRVLALYPDLMNIYADRGNIAVLRARCEWRGHGFELAAASLGEAVDPKAHDLFYMGGGQDRDQAAVAQDMTATKRDALHAAAGRGAVILAVCGGYQLLGHSYQMDGRVLSGHGNNAGDGFEGVHRHNVVGTYLHGPLLPKNVWLADRLIELALAIELEPLDDAMEDAAHASARRAAGV